MLYLVALCFACMCAHASSIASSKAHPPSRIAASMSVDAYPAYPALPSRPGLSLDIAKSIANACRLEAQQNDWAVVISIVDDGGNLLYLERMDTTQLGSIAVSQDKAASALLFKRPTKVFSDMVIEKGSVNMMALRGSVAVEGGVPLVARGGTVVGAIGISGVTSTQDGQIAAAGLAYFDRLYNNNSV